MKVGRQRARFLPGARSPTLAEGAWELDPARSAVAFAVPYWWGFGTVKGHFTQYAGRLELGVRPAIELAIDAASVTTGNERRDHHLRSDEFFAVGRDPYIRFVSRTVRLEGDRLSVLGELMARGRRIEADIDATVTAVDGEYQLEAQTFVMHSGLGMTWNPMGITRPWSKLVVGGRLVAVPAEPSETRPAAPGRRFARASHGPFPYWACRSRQ